MNKQLRRVLMAGLATVLLLQAGFVVAGRMELASVLEFIPPNGPPARYGNVVIEPQGEGALPVVFPHWLHRARYTCKTCHLDLGFSIYRGESMLTRRKLLAGKFCGACHNGSEAFSLQKKAENCDRCHRQDSESLDGKFEEYAYGLPESDSGNGIDWPETLAKGYIRPRDSLGGQRRASMTLPEKLKKPLGLGTNAPRSNVAFSHQDHFQWLDCSNCHPQIFTTRQESTRLFSMEQNVFGRFCGTCHLRVAFPVQDCHSCHPQMKNRSMP